MKFPQELASILQVFTEWCIAVVLVILAVGVGLSFIKKPTIDCEIRLVQAAIFMAALGYVTLAIRVVITIENMS